MHQRYTIKGEELLSQLIIESRHERPPMRAGSIGVNKQDQAEDIMDLDTTIAGYVQCERDATL